MTREAGATPRAAPSIGRMLATARFEVVPIKGLREQARFLPAGATVTVTCSPRHGIGRTLSASEFLAGQGFGLVPHISARLISGDRHLDEVVERLRAAGIQEVFVVGGDVPEPVGPFPSSVALLSAMAERGVRFSRVGIAGYPERHPFLDPDALMEALRAKQRFATYVVTQICFDPAATLRWIRELRGGGIGLPVYIGLPGPLKRRKLLEISIRVGVGDSLRFVAGQRGLLLRLARRGGYSPDAFVASIASLLRDDDRTVAGFHINTFNQVDVAERWRQGALAATGASGGADAEGYPTKSRS